MDKVVVNNLVKNFGDFRAVDNIQFTIKENEFFSLLGPSGCGKSTTLRCIAGLEDPQGGTIEIGGKTMYGERINLPPNKRSLGMVFQNYAVWPHMTVYDNIAYPLKIAKKNQNEIKKTVSRVIQTLGITGLEKRKPHELSGGQQQRVALGRSLAMEPEVLLLDEPLSNLDAKLREEMRVELKTIQQKTGIPILYVTHDQLEAMAMSDRIAVMNKGVILQCADPATIYRNPADKFVYDFIGQTNYIDCEVLRENTQSVSVSIDNKTVEVPMPSNIPKAKSVRLGVRPEDIVLSNPGKNDKDTLQGEVMIFLYLGNLIEYRVQVGEKLLQVHGNKYELFEVGNTVNLDFKEVMLWER